MIDLTSSALPIPLDIPPHLHEKILRLLKPRRQSPQRMARLGTENKHHDSLFRGVLRNRAVLAWHADGMDAPSNFVCKRVGQEIVGGEDGAEDLDEEGEGGEEDGGGGRVGVGKVE